MGPEREWWLGGGADPGPALKGAQRRFRGMGEGMTRGNGSEAPCRAAEALLEVFVAGVPRPQGSKRHVGRGILIEASREVGPWREAIAAAVLGAGVKRQEGPVAVELVFLFDRPKAHYGAKGLKEGAPKWKASRPDVDKLSRAVLDALVPVVLRDDALVVRLVAEKRWAEEGERPGVLVRILAVRG